MKRIITLIALVALPMLAGCSAVTGAATDARVQVCNSMRGVTQNVTDVTNALNDRSTQLTVGDLKTKFKPVRDIIATARPVANAAGADGLVTTLNTAFTNMDKALEGTTDSTNLSSVADKLTTPVSEVQTSFGGLLTRLCPAQ